MTELLYMLCFFVFSGLQSAMINGIHLSMDGKDRINKAGEWYGTGDIFYGIARTLRAATKNRSLLKKGAARLAIKNASERATKPYPLMIIVEDDESDLIMYKKNTPEGAQVIAALQDMQINYGVHYSEGKDFDVDHDTDATGYFLLWVETVKYKYPVWIRKSVGGGCIKCMASFYGPVTFIPMFLFLYGHQVIMYPLAFINILVLVYFNYYLYKR